MASATGISGTLLDQLPDGVLLIGIEEEAIRDVNETFCLMSGWSRDQVLGRSPADFIHPDDLQVAPLDPNRVPPGHIAVTERRYRRADGSLMWCETRTRRTELGFLVLIRDIGPVVRDREQLQMLTELARLRTELAAALMEPHGSLPAVLDRAAAALATVIGDVCVIGLVDRARGLVVPAAYHHRDPEGTKFLDATLPLQSSKLGAGLAGKVAVDGIPVRVADLPPDQVRAAVTPPYRPFVDRFSVSSIMIVPLRGQDAIVGVLGLARGPAYTDHDEQMVSDLAHLVVLAIEDARHDAQLNQAMFLLKTATDALPARVSYWNADQRNEFANDAYRQWLGLRPEEINGRHVRDVIGEDLYEIALPHIRRVLEGHRQEFDLPLEDASGQTRHYQVAYVPDRRPDGRVAGFVVLATDVTNLTRTAAEFEYQALHDPLTGLANRRALLDHIELALNQAQRAGGAVAVFYLDLDNFKNINDTEGHRVGDQVLIATANRIRGMIRQGDTAARLGGDEFVIVCQVRDRPEADDIGGRLQTALNQSIALEHNRSLTTSASIGVAFFEGPDSVSPEHLLAAADTAMFHNKRGQPASAAAPGPPAEPSGRYEGA